MDFSKFQNKLEQSQEVIRSLIGNPYVEVVRKEIAGYVDSKTGNKQVNPQLLDSDKLASNESNSDSNASKRVGIASGEIREKFPCVYTSGSALVVEDERKLGEIQKLRVYIKKSDVQNSKLKEIRNTDWIVLNGKEYEIESIKDAYRFYIIGLK